MYTFLSIFALALICANFKSGFGYSIPTPTLELLSPQGFRISIPDESGIALFAFHGAINRPIKGIQRGDFSGEATSPTNGRWAYENRKTFLDPGDILYYWIHVQHGSHAYRLLEKSIKIPNEKDNEVSTESTPTRWTTRSSTSTTSTTSTSTEDPLSNINFDDLLTDCELSQTTVNGRKMCKGSLIFSDEFDTIDWSKWQREIKLPMDTDDADFVSFQNRPENCYVSGGNLNIVPNLLVEVPGYNEERIRRGELSFGTNCTGIQNIELECKRRAGFFRILPPVVSAKIRTKDVFSFRYGRVVVRAKLTKGDWLFPLIALEPAVNHYGISGYASGQMRIAYIRGNEYLDTKMGDQIDGKRVSGGVILTTGATYRDNWMKSSLRADHLGNDFHVYTMTWTDQSITLSIDGNDYATIRGGFRDLHRTHNISHAQGWSNGEYMAPFDKEFFISLGVSAGGISDFPDGCRTGEKRLLKPWANTSPKAELKFWNDRYSWHDTWNGEDAGLKVDYIKVYAL